MTFLSTASQKIYLIMQRNHKKYEQDILVLRYNIAKDQIDALQDYYRDLNGSGGTITYDIEDNDQYQMLQRLSDQLDAEQQSLEQSITVLDQQISSGQNLMKESIKASCGLTLSGG